MLQLSMDEIKDIYTEEQLDIIIKDCKECEHCEDLVEHIQVCLKQL